jgi:hypothetical protein
MSTRLRKGLLMGDPSWDLGSPNRLSNTYFRKKIARPTTRWQKTHRDFGPWSDPILAFQGSFIELQLRILEKGESSRACLKPVSPVCCLDSPATCQSNFFNLVRPNAILEHLVSELSLSARSLHDCPSLAVALAFVSASSFLSQPSSARGLVFSKCCYEVLASNFLSLSSLVLVGAPMICQDSPILPMSGPDFSITFECPPDLAEVLAWGQDLQIMPSCAMGQFWEPLVGVPPTLVTSASFQFGGSVLCGMDFALDFSRFGGREPLFVARLKSFGEEEGQYTKLIMSHDGEEEGRLVVEPLNVLFPCVVNESKFPDWVVKCAEQIHSRVGITYVG